MKSGVLVACLVILFLNLLLGQGVVRNSSDFSDEDYSRFKKALIDCSAWEQLQADFLEWSLEYPIRQADLRVIHLVEEPIVSLYMTNEKLSVIEANRIYSQRTAVRKSLSSSSKALGHMKNTSVTRQALALSPLLLRPHF